MFLQAGHQLSKCDNGMVYMLQRDSGLYCHEPNGKTSMKQNNNILKIRGVQVDEIKIEESWLLLQWDDGGWELTTIRMKSSPKDSGREEWETEAGTGLEALNSPFHQNRTVSSTCYNKQESG